MQKFKLHLSAVFVVILLLVAVSISSCNSDYPHHSVAEGKQNMIVYKLERCDDGKYGTYKYAITDATGAGWTLYSFKKFELGDTLSIENGYHSQGK